MSADPFTTPKKLKQDKKQPPRIVRVKSKCKERIQRVNTDKDRSCRRLFAETAETTETTEENICEKAIEGILLILLAGIVCVLYVSLK